jgi:hypothetical protein
LEVLLFDVHESEALHSYCILPLEIKNPSPSQLREMGSFEQKTKPAINVC